MLRLLKQYFPIRNILFIIMEGLMIYGSVCLSFYLLSQRGAMSLDLFLFLRIFLVTMVCQIALYYNELYDFEIAVSIPEVCIRLIMALGVTSIALAAIYFAFPATIIDQEIFILSVVFLMIFITGWRVIYIWILSKGMFNESILVLGSTPLAYDIMERINNTIDCGYQVDLFIPEYPDEEIDDIYSSKIDSACTKENFCRAALKKGVRKVVVALKEKRGSFPMQELLQCRTEGIEVLEGSTFYEMLSGKVLVTQINPSWLIYSEGFSKSRLQSWIKRIEDIIIATIMLILLSPVLLITAILIKLDSRGPVLFSQDRVGQHQKEYMMHKFRSMREDAEQLTGPVWAEKDDPRITRVGRVIRKFRIDELPQLWDVLVGKMSMVGPRPERRYFTDELEKQIPFYTERFKVKPGVTGWAQVSYDYGSTVEDAIEKLNYDLFYIKNLSIPMDIVIILRTVKTVLFGRGSR